MATAELNNRSSEESAKVTRLPRPSEETHDDALRLRLQRTAWDAFAEVRGPRYARCRLSNFAWPDPRQATAVAKLRQYAADCWSRIEAGQNVVLFGVSGTGKDHLITGLVHEIIRYFTALKSTTFAWQSGPGLFAEVRAAIGKESTVDPLRKYIDAPVLVLSDLAPPSGKLTDWQADTAYRLVDARYNHLRPIFATINAKSRAHMEEILGVAVTDRLRDGALAIPCDWASYREAAK